MSKTVLIVDDERLLVRTLSTVLKEAGYRTLTASSAEQAEKQLDADDGPDLVVLDNRLPKRSGLDVLRHIRERGLPCRVILMTAYDSPDVKREAERLAVDRYVLKPFDLSTMMSTITDLLARNDRPTQTGGR